MTTVTIQLIQLEYGIGVRVEGIDRDIVDKFNALGRTTGTLKTPEYGANARIASLVEHYAGHSQP